MAHDQEKRVLITGAARRIGREIALTLARAGWDILLHYRHSVDAAQALVHEIATMGRCVTLVHADFEKEEDVHHLLASMREAPVHALVHNASLFERDAQDPDGTRHRRINAVVPALLTQVLFDSLPPTEEGAVIYILDNTPMPPFLSHYAASRVLLREKMAPLAQNYAPRVRVNAMALGPVMRGVRESPDHFQRMVATTPLARAVTPEEVAHTVQYLLHTRAITGQVLNVDSGMHIKKM